MSNAAAIAIFVKTPGLSPIKTRLAAGMGTRYAELWYRLAAAAVAEAASLATEALGAAVYWAVAEAAAMDDPQWWSLPRIAQGDGDLGERMGRVHTRLLQDHAAVILLGADVPQVTRTLLTRAIAFLDSDLPSSVFGPAGDGGFWLYGSNCGVPMEAWTAPDYGTADTGTTFRLAVGTHHRWYELETLIDVDTAEQLNYVYHVLAALPDKPPAQAALFDWMQTQSVQVVYG
jgi:hypothetical protein